MTGKQGQTRIFRAAKYAGLSLFFFAAFAQGEEVRTLDTDSGAELRYAIRSHAANAHVVDPSAQPEPTSALGTAILLNRHLSAGRIEDAALLSNAPRRRFEVLREYRESIGEEEFRRVFAAYFTPANRLLAEVAIGAHRLLIWELTRQAQFAGQYFVEVDGRWLIDDVPNETRSSLRRVLEAYRAGKSQ